LNKARKTTGLLTNLARRLAEQLLLSIRSETRLRKAKLLTIRDLIQLTAQDLVRRTRTSSRGFKEITDSLASIGLSLAMTIDSAGNLLQPEEPASLEYPKPEPADPSQYVVFYRNRGGYSFLPQGLMDDFYRVISSELQDRMSRHRKNIDRQKQADGSNSYESWKDIIYEEARIDEENALLSLTDELMFLGLYRFIEIERLRILSDHFPMSRLDKAHTYARLLQMFPWLQDLFGSSAINEIRLINNGIKHSGRVSRELSRYHTNWVESEQLRGLREAYERLAPYVGAYWVDLCRSCVKKGSQLKT
jgi:hypothetical protein